MFAFAIYVHIVSVLPCVLGSVHVKPGNDPVAIHAADYLVLEVDQFSASELEQAKTATKLLKDRLEAGKWNAWTADQWDEIEIHRMRTEIVQALWNAERDKAHARSRIGSLEKEIASLERAGATTGLNEKKKQMSQEREKLANRRYVDMETLRAARFGALGVKVSFTSPYKIYLSDAVQDAAAHTKNRDADALLMLRDFLRAEFESAAKIVAEHESGSVATTEGRAEHFSRHRDRVKSLLELAERGDRQNLQRKLREQADRIWHSGILSELIEKSKAPQPSAQSAPPQTSADVQLIQANGELIGPGPVRFKVAVRGILRYKGPKGKVDCTFTLADGTKVAAGTALEPGIEYVMVTTQKYRFTLSPRP